MEFDGDRYERSSYFTIESIVSLVSITTGDISELLIKLKEISVSIKENHDKPRL